MADALRSDETENFVKLKNDIIAIFSKPFTYGCLIIVYWIANKLRAAWNAAARRQERATGLQHDFKGYDTSADDRRDSRGLFFH